MFIVEPYGSVQPPITTVVHKVRILTTNQI